jgi:hypothetical protein
MYVYTLIKKLKGHMILTNLYSLAAHDGVGIHESTTA